MTTLFLCLTFANLVALASAATLGYAGLMNPDWASAHRMSGVMAAFLCVAVHSVVFTYFIATAKWIQHAVESRGLSTALSAPTKSFKAQAFPAALLSMAAVFAAALLGAAVDVYGIARIWHHTAIWCAIAVNLAGAAVEFRAIRRNGALIDQILLQVNGPE